jgi:phosphohistidine phosphatase
MPQPTFEIYLLRHAHAGNAEDWAGDDSKRPLSGKGRKQAKRLGHFLAERGIKPDAIVSSPKVRAVETAELVAGSLKKDVRVDQRLAGFLDVAALAALVEEAGGSRVLLVGHDPDFSDLAAALVGADDLPMKKGALARIDVAPPIREGSGVLRWLVPPDLLEADT